MQATSLVLVVACAAICAANRASAAAANEGDNAAAYATLCSAVAVLSTPYAAPSTPEINDALLAEAQALNFSLHHPEAADELAQEGKDSMDKLKKGGKAQKLATEQSFADYKNKAATAKAMAKERPYARVKKTLNNGFLTTQIKKVIDDIQATVDITQKIKVQEHTNTANSKMNKAVYGTDEPNDSVRVVDAAGATTRDAVCGKPGNANAQRRAGKSLKQDIMCICALLTSGQGQTACANLSPALDKDPTGGTDLEDDWKKLHQTCLARYHKNAPTADRIRAVAANVQHTIAQSTANGNKITHILGKTNRDPATNGCNGDVGDNSGCCVYYGRGAGATLTYKIEWAEAMEEAAQAIKAAEQAAAQKTELLAKLTLLNTTLANLAKAAMEAQAAASPTTERAPQQADTKTAEDQEKVCNAAGNDENKCKDLESQGCKYDENKPADQKCTLKKEVKEKLEKEGKKDGATATTVKCSEYGSQDKCEEVNKEKDKPVCGWRSGKDNEDDKDAKKCRNGSFLASKQFALIAVVFDCLVAF